MPASTRRLPRSSRHATDWPRSSCNWCVRFPSRNAVGVMRFSEVPSLTMRPPRRATVDSRSMLVTTKRGLSLGFLPVARTTSALQTTRRFHGQLLRASGTDIQRRHARSARRSSNRRRARFMADAALRFNTALTRRNRRGIPLSARSPKNPKTSGAAKPPSKRTRILAFGKASVSRSIKRRSRPTAPAEPGAFPGRNTAVTSYCSASWLKVRKPTIGR